MHLETYDASTGNPTGTLTRFDFGQVIQGQHSYRPLVFRVLPDSETISNLKIFLQDTGGNAEYGYYTNATFQSSVKSGGPELQSHFVEVSDASSSSPNGVTVPLVDSTSNYIWMDVFIPTSQNSTIDPNFRFFFNY